MFEDLRTVYPILLPLYTDSKKLFEFNRSALDGTECKRVGNPTVSPPGKLGCLMVARTMYVKCKSYRYGVGFNQSSSQPTRDLHRIIQGHACQEADQFVDPSLLDLVGSKQHEEVLESVEKSFQNAMDNRLPDTYLDRLKPLVYSHIHGFRVAFSSGPHAGLLSLRIELSEQSSSVKCRIRDYSSEQKQFLQDWTKEMVGKGLAYPNQTGKWAPAPLIVPKLSKAKFRFTVDLQASNKLTIKQHYPMPVLKKELTRLAGSKTFANTEHSHSYWQLPSHKDSQYCQSFLTPEGGYAPTPVMHGSRDALSHLQSLLTAEVLEQLRPVVLQWLDDLL